MGILFNDKQKKQCWKTGRSSIPCNKDKDRSRLHTEINKSVHVKKSLSCLSRLHYHFHTRFQVKFIVCPNSFILSKNKKVSKFDSEGILKEHLHVKIEKKSNY